MPGRARMIMYTIYKDPRDYPGLFVVRAFHIEAGSAVPARAPIAVVCSIEAARGALPVGLGLVRMPREEGDDPVIVESWL